MSRWLGKWHEIRGALVWALSRFPVAVIALAVFALYVNLVIAEVVDTSDNQVARAGVALVGAAAIATAVVLLGERIGAAVLLRQLASLALAAIVGTSLWYWQRLAVAFPGLLLATLLSVPLAPYLGRDLSGFWAFIWRLAHAVALALVAIVVFCLGLSAIFATIDYLFGVDIKSSLYGHIWSIGLGFVGPLFALSLIPKDFPDRDVPEASDVFVAGMRILSDFVAVPLLAIYVVILHVYAVKILVETELPKGQIGWMVLSFGLAVLALRIVVHPMASLAWRPTRFFLRYWAIGLVVPLVLLVIAVWQRIAIYGVTPERYALALFALFLGFVLLAQLLPRWRGDIRVMPALGALVLLFASVGPWSMIPVSARSQIDRLMHRLADVGALHDGKLTERPRFMRAAAEEVHSITSLLARIRQLDRLRPLFAGYKDDPFATDGPIGLSQIRRTLGVEPLPPSQEYAGNFQIRGGLGVVPIDDYDLVAPNMELAGVRSAALPLGDALSLVVKLDGYAIQVISNGQIHQITPDMLRDAFAQRIESVENRLAQRDRPPFLIELALDGRRVAILFQDVTGKLTDQAFSLSSGTFDLYLRRAEWVDASGG